MSIRPGDEAQTLAQRGARVGVGAVIEQQAGEGGVALQPAKISLRHDAAEQRSLPAEAVGVDFGARVHVGAMLDQPACDLDLVKVDAFDMQQRGSGVSGVPCRAKEWSALAS